MPCNSSFGSNQLIILSALLSILISDDLSADELNILSTVISSIGDLIATKAAQLQYQESKNKSK